MQMYAIELTPEFEGQAARLHPRRYKQVHQRIFALQANPRPPDSMMLDLERYLLPAGPYTIAYKIDDAQRRVRVLLLEARAT
jgi:mRNA-degrading endonuclease RelE of RelBE toxin-antitoxin system